MDTVGDDAWKSVRLAWEAERWLPIGMPVAALAFALWVGLTGAAVGFLADLGIGTVTVDPWTVTTDAVAGILFLCWVVAPAAIVTWLVRTRLTTVRGTLEIGYRVHHPILLFVPPVLVLGAGSLALIGLGRAAPPVLGVLLAGALWFLIRVVAYSYRVFSFSVPVLTYAMTLFTAGLLALVALVTGVRVAGRGDLVDAVAVALAARTDSPALVTLVGGTMDVAGVDVPALAATLIGVPVALGAAYVAVQLAASVAVRLVKPTKRRPELRSGQRYPEFARPTTTVAPAAPPDPNRSPSAGSTDAGGEPRTDRGAGDGAATDGATDDRSDDLTTDDPTTDDAATDETESEPDLSNTRVFTAGDDAPSVSPTAVAPDDECPSCGTALDADVSGTCPDCGADL